MKSGYSTKILVHKEGIMTNEEIFQLVDKALKNQEKKYNSIIVGILSLYVFGIILMYIPIAKIDTEWIKVIVVLFWVISFIECLYTMGRYTERYAKIRREFTYNLVRKDERMRIKNGTL